MTDPTIAIIVSIILGPTIAQGLAWWIRRSERREDWLRQDKVADRVAGAAKQAEDAAALLVASNAEVATAADSVAKDLTRKLDDIHTLVNSSLTQAMRDTSTAQKAQLVLMLEKAGTKPSGAMASAIAGLRAIIGEGESMLDERATAQATVDDRSGG